MRALACCAALLGVLAARPARAQEPAPEQRRPYEALAVTLSGKGFQRTFTYVDPLAEVLPETGARGLANYAAPFVPSVALDVAWYPFAHAAGDYAANVGIIGGFHAGDWVRTRDCLGGAPSQEQCNFAVAYPTSSWSYVLGLRVRFPVELATALSIVPYIDVGLGEEGFAIGADAATGGRPEVPDVRYSAVHLSAGARVWMGPVFVEPRLTYLYVVDIRELSDASWFPRASSAGFDGALRVGVAIHELCEIRAGLTWRHYATVMNNRASDDVDRVAAGAMDVYVGGDVGVAFILPGAR